ncbi:MAG: lipoate--protein ligase family protein [Promethearchaeota archaeon]
MYNWRLIPLETNDGFMNMALDEAILRAVIEKKSPYTLRFYKWKPSTASIGRNQSLFSEIDMKTAKDRGFNVVRRITGGGAVFHDEFREITYSIVCPIKYLENLGAKTVIEQFEIITQGITAGLYIFGLKPEKGVIHCPALFLEGKKFSGNAQARKRGYILQHGTILLEINPELMYSILTPPKNITKSKMVQSVYAKCIGIKEHINSYEESRFLECLKMGFEEVLNIKLEEEPFTKFERELAEHLRKEKYSNEEWLKKYE